MPFLLYKNLLQSFSKVFFVFFVYFKRFLQRQDANESQKNDQVRKRNPYDRRSFDPEPYRPNIIYRHGIHPDLRTESRDRYPFGQQPSRQNSTDNEFFPDHVDDHKNRIPFWKVGNAYRIHSPDEGESAERSTIMSSLDDDEHLPNSVQQPVDSNKTTRVSMPPSISVPNPVEQTLETPGQITQQPINLIKDMVS